VYDEAEKGETYSIFASKIEFEVRYRNRLFSS
jgi:hypothetical protein